MKDSIIGKIKYKLILPIWVIKAIQSRRKFDQTKYKQTIALYFWIHFNFTDDCSVVFQRPNFAPFYISR